MRIPLYSLQPQSAQTLTASNTVALFRDRLRLSSLVAYRGCYVSHNVNNLFQSLRQTAGAHVEGFDSRNMRRPSRTARLCGIRG